MSPSPISEFYFLVSHNANQLPVPFHSGWSYHLHYRCWWPAYNSKCITFFFVYFSFILGHITHESFSSTNLYGFCYQLTIFFLISIKVTNHMVRGEGGVLKPALGESWKSIPHVRLQLSCDRVRNICQATVLKHTFMVSSFSSSLTYIIHAIYLYTLDSIILAVVKPTNLGAIEESYVVSML